MSIYPVKLSKWFPAKGDKTKEWHVRKRNKSLYETARFIVSLSTCCICNKKINYRHAWGMHSVPWGHGTEHIWCSEECLKGHYAS